MTKAEAVVRQIAEGKESEMPVKWIVFGNGKIATCPVCDNLLGVISKYCDQCGQKVIKGKEKEIC